MVPLILWILIGASLSFGQDTTSATVRPSAGQTKLNLDQAVEMALQNNLDIEIDKSNVEDAVQAMRGSRGIYDLRVR